MWMLIIAMSVQGSSDFDSMEAELHLDTGFAMLQQGLLDQAEEEFDSVLTLGDEYPTALLGLGMIYSRRSSWEPAMEYFHMFIQADPDDYRGYYRMADLYFTIGKPDSAAMMSDSAFARAPTQPEVWLLCGKIQMELGNMDAAETWFSRGMEDSGTTSMESLVLLASVYRLTERGQEARELLLPAVESGYAPACWELARVYLGWKDYMRAADAIENYLMLSPEGCYADSAELVLQELGESGDYIIR